MSEGESAPALSPEKKKFKVVLPFFVLIVVGLVAVEVTYHLVFPFGYSNASSERLGKDFLTYATNHNHWFPYGESTPEASLGLLYKDDTNAAALMLGGKIVSRDTAAATLKEHGRISPETCGWHYVEGLRDDDDDAIVVAWDKAKSLGHYGQRTSN